MVWMVGGEASFARHARRTSVGFVCGKLRLWHVCACMNVCRHVCTYASMHECMYSCGVCMYVCTYVRMHVCMFIFMYVYMDVCMYVCMYVDLCVGAGGRQFVSQISRQQVLGAHACQSLAF